MRYEQLSVGELTVDMIRGGASLDMFTKKIFVDPVNGSDSAYAGKSISNAKKTLAAGYAALRTNKNEALILVPGASYHGLIDHFVWAHSFTHLIGLAGPGVYGGRNRIYDTAAFHEMLFSITGIGNIFKVIHWQRDFNSALGVQNVTLGTNASYNYFEDCQFDSPIMAALGAAAYRNLTLGDGARSNTFRRCTIGQWNQLAAATDGFQIYGVGGTNGNAGTHFMDCVVLWYTNQATMSPINISNLIDVNAYVLFDRCKFLGLGTTVNGLCTTGTPTAGKIIFSNCSGMGFTEYDASANARIFVCNSSTGDDAAGIGVAVSS